MPKGNASFAPTSNTSPSASPPASPSFSASSASSAAPANATRAAEPERLSATDSFAEARATVARLRDEASDRARPLVKSGAAPIRVMASMVRELETTCRELGIPTEVMASEVVNRTIGDVDLRRVTAAGDGPEFVSLADDMGLALPGEMIDGRRSTGKTYRWLRTRMMDFERELLSRHVDLRSYDLNGTGNPLLREMISSHAERHWGYTFPPTQIYLSLGALDGLDKFFRGFAFAEREAGADQIAVMFPAPSFNVPEWQAKSLGLRLHRLYTRPEDHFKVTPDQLRAALAEASDIRAFYLTVSNNPTAFAYTPDELRALFAALREQNRSITIVADLAYIGTGDPDEDRARMAAFNDPETLAQSVFVSSFSKTHTLTGDRMGWVGFGDAALAQRVIPGWVNSTASLPADWQLRYMANMRLFAERPTLEKRIRALYRLRRERLMRQLQRLDEQRHIFAQVNLDDGGTVYNWSQLRAGEDVFSLFGKTGIAGVPGSAFGYSDDFVRLSIGWLPVPEE